MKLEEAFELARITLDEDTEAHTGNADPLIRAAYQRGYRAGKDDRNAMAQKAAAHYGHVVNVLRLADD